MNAESKKPIKKSRFTLASVYLVAGLIVCYLVLTQLIPSTVAVTNNGARPDGAVEDEWHQFSGKLATWVKRNKFVTVGLFVVLGVCGVVLPWLFRPARYLVWVLAIGVLLLDIALTAGGYWRMVSRLLYETEQMRP